LDKEYQGSPEEHHGADADQDEPEVTEAAQNHEDYKRNDFIIVVALHRLAFFIGHLYPQGKMCDRLNS
jgi:hypothetical protein